RSAPRARARSAPRTAPSPDPATSTVATCASPSALPRPLVQHLARRIHAVDRVAPPDRPGRTLRTHELVGRLRARIPARRRRLKRLRLRGIRPEEHRLATAARDLRPTVVDPAQVVHAEPAAPDVGVLPEPPLRGRQTAH